MKLAIFSDVHANPAALKKVLEDAGAKGCEQYICLGDIVGYGYDCNRCIEICKENKVECILGNHDAGCIGILDLRWFNYTAEQGVKRGRAELTEDNHKWLGNLPYQIKKDFGLWRCCFSHGSYSSPSDFNYIYDVRDASLEFDLMYADNIDILFVGHTHWAVGYGSDHSNGYYIFPPGENADNTIDPNLYRSVIVNVGSIGYPRNQPFSSYVIFDTEEQTIVYHSVKFDYADYVARLDSHHIAIPHWLAERMSHATT